MECHEKAGGRLRCYFSNGEVFIPETDVARAEEYKEGEMAAGPDRPPAPVTVEASQGATDGGCGRHPGVHGQPDGHGKGSHQRMEANPRYFAAGRLARLK